MTTAPHDQPRHSHLAGWLPFIRHYIEMVLAMAIGMFALMARWAPQPRLGAHLVHAKVRGGPPAQAGGPPRAR